MLDYIKSKSKARAYFQKNGNSDQFTKFESDPEVNEFHNLMTYFNAFHVPLRLLDSKRPVFTPDDLSDCHKH
jgi:hypothetical protein